MAERRRSGALTTGWIVTLAAVAGLVACGSSSGDPVADPSPVAANPTGAPPVPSEAPPERTGPGYRLTDKFSWSGTHAAYLSGKHATTTWWNPDVWDSRVDTSYVTHTAGAEEGGAASGHHVDVHKAYSADPTDGRQSNDTAAVGGRPGAPGVGVMRVANQGVVSARLRNPLLISDRRAGVVSFYANRFVDTGNWWEVSLTPSNALTTADQTAVGGVTLGNLTPQNPRESVNVSLRGQSDLPCDHGWQSSAMVTRTVGGARPVETTATRPVTGSPDEPDRLTHFELRYTTTAIELWADLDDTGSLTLVNSFAGGVPWAEADVHLIAAAYQNDHHPANCRDKRRDQAVREFSWRDFTAYPVKYQPAATEVFPKRGSTKDVPRESGWRRYDLRDTQRYTDDYNAPANDLPLPNTEAYPDGLRQHLYCFGKWNYQFDAITCRNAGPDGALSPTVRLAFPAPRRDGYLLAGARLVYDVRNVEGTESSATVAVNGRPPVALPQSYGASHDRTGYTQRAVTLDPATFAAGDNTLDLTFGGDAATSSQEYDRFELEYFWVAD